MRWTFNFKEQNLLLSSLKADWERFFFNSYGKVAVIGIDMLHNDLQCCGQVGSMVSSHGKCCGAEKRVRGKVKEGKGC